MRVKSSSDGEMGSSVAVPRSVQCSERVQDAAPLLCVACTSCPSCTNRDTYLRDPCGSQP